MPSQAALLIGGISHARKEWESLSSILTLKVWVINLCIKAGAIKLIRAGIPQWNSRGVHSELQGRSIR